MSMTTFDFKWTKFSASDPELMNYSTLNGVFEVNAGLNALKTKVRNIESHD
jgi:hypothetical protein